VEFAAPIGAGFDLRSVAPAHVYAVGAGVFAGFAEFTLAEGDSRGGASEVSEGSASVLSGGGSGASEVEFVSGVAGSGAGGGEREFRLS